jgi:membrane protein YdbS with pleckstrin-like domain
VSGPAWGTPQRSTARPPLSTRPRGEYIVRVNDFLPLDPRARLLFYLQAFSRLTLFWVPVSSVLAAVVAYFAASLVAGVVVGGSWFFAMFLLALWMPALSWSRWGYLLREDELLITRGVLVRRVTAIPTMRIQHVDTRQGPVEQWMGLARLQIHTASGVGSDGVIPGLTLGTAEALRDQLVEVEGDDGV